METPKVERDSPEFAWSNSRASLFSDCQRQYYFNYYAYWKGNDEKASKLAKEVWALKKFATIPQWTGNVVHDVIAESFIKFRDTGKISTIEDLFDSALDKVEQAIEDTKTGRWKTDKDAIRLFEIERDGCINPKSDAEIEKRIFASLTSFYNSDIRPYLLGIDPKDWLSIDERNTMVISEVPVIAAADFAFRDHDGEVFIIDWKTGKEKKDAIQQQLLVYADMAQRLWNAEPNKIRLVGVFLAEDARISQYELGNAIEMQESFHKRMKESVEGMRRLVVDGDLNRNIPVDSENFKIAKHKKSCIFCQYKDLCNQYSCFPHLYK